MSFISISFQDKAKMEIRKQSSSPEPEEIRSMIYYAKTVIEEFRKAKHYKNILFLCLYAYCPLSLVSVFSHRLVFAPLGLSVCLSSWTTTFHFPDSSSFSTKCVTVPWLSCTPDWAAGDMRAQPGEDGSCVRRHQRVHAAHDVSGHGRLSLHAGLGRSHELRREDHSAVQVNWSVQGGSNYKVYNVYNRWI